MQGLAECTRVAVQLAIQKPIANWTFNDLSVVGASGVRAFMMSAMTLQFADAGTAAASPHIFR
eukprot:3905279-Pyramimonas_sp.AAC.1